jgi:hypothetical protein
MTGILDQNQIDIWPQLLDHAGPRRMDDVVLLSPDELPRHADVAELGGNARIRRIIYGRISWGIQGVQRLKYYIYPGHRVVGYGGS